MTTLIIHLTDIHIDNARDPIIGRARAIAAAALSDLAAVPTSCIVISTGDIAQSGTSEQYDVAKTFYADLGEEISARSNIPVTNFLVPGNHDCKLPADLSVRQDVIESTLRKGLTQARENQLLEVQNDFIDFAKSLSAQHFTSRWESTLVLPGLGMSLVGLNTAGFSTIPEGQGRLMVPIQSVKFSSETPLTIYAMHHPLAWLESNNARDVLEKIRDTADIMLFGHEHREDLMAIEGIYNDAKYEAIFGDVLQERGNLFNSAFRTLLISEDKKQIKARRYIWAGNRYESDSEKSDKQWRQLRSGAVRRKTLSFSSAHLDWIEDPGAAFTHRKKEKLQLSDLFVWPMLRQNIPDKGQSLLVDSAQFSAENLLSSLPEASVAYVLGDEQCGKTTLAKRLCLSFRQEGFFPLYISGKKSPKAKSVSDELVEERIDEQYGCGSRSEYSQQKPTSRILIVDDYELIKGGKEAKQQMLDNLRPHFSRIILFVSSSPGFELALEEMGTSKKIFDPIVFDFLPLSFKLRSELIENWLRVGDKEEIDQQEVEAVTSRFARIVDDTLGRNLIPSIPIFVLIILQQSESERDIDAVVKNGSQGFLYEALITQTLMRKVGMLSVDTATTYLTMFAGRLFKKGSGEGLLESEAIEFHLHHSEEFDLDYKYERLKLRFVSADIWIEKQDKLYFKYAYLYYFFVAKYLMKLSTQEREAAVDGLICSIHTERSANILLFLAHLSQDEIIIKKLVKCANECFEGRSEYDLFEAKNVLEKFGANNIRHVYVEYESRRQRLEEAERDASDVMARVPDENADPEFWSGEVMLISVNRAFKSMQVLGQVLRNHSGSIRAPLKREIANVCVSLGLRTLHCLMEVCSETAPHLIESRLDVPAKSGKPGTGRKPDAETLRNDAEIFLRDLVLNVAVGTFIKIAGAIGSEELSPTLTKVLQPEKGGSRGLVDLAVRLENFTRFPEAAVKEFRERKLSVDEVMPTALLRRFIMRRFYLFPDKKEIKTRICDLFKIARKPYHLLSVQRGKSTR